MKIEPFGICCFAGDPGLPAGGLQYKVGPVQILQCPDWMVPLTPVQKDVDDDDEHASSLMLSYLYNWVSHSQQPRQNQPEGWYSPCQWEKFDPSRSYISMSSLLPGNIRKYTPTA